MFNANKSASWAECWSFLALGKGLVMRWEGGGERVCPSRSLISRGDTVLILEAPPGALRGAGVEILRRAARPPCAAGCRGNGRQEEVGAARALPLPGRRPAAP